MPQNLIVRARDRYVHLLVRRETEAFCAKAHADWLAAIRKAKNVERHIRRLNDELSNEQWQAIFTRRVA